MQPEHITNCPNCGAVIKDNVCEYCGTQFVDMSFVETNKPFYLTIKNGGLKYTAKVCVDQVTMNATPESVSCLDFNGRFRRITTWNRSIDVSFVVVGDFNEP